MNGLNSFMALSVPAGRIAGIAIRIHILFIIYVVFRVWELRDEGLTFGLLYLAGVYVCILLHEFGHALSARWCGGEANEILIWPLGGLAYCRPPLHPTPHLICTVGGPFVTMVLWGLLTVTAHLISPAPFARVSEFHSWSWIYIASLAETNLWLLLFNMVPAFPMDGGRILRDTLWHFMPVQKANRIATVVGFIACLGLISWGISSQNQWMVFIGLFAILGGAQEMAAFAHVEPWQIEHWSLREHLGLRERAAARPPRRARRQASPLRDPGLVYESKIVPRSELRDDRAAVAKIDAILDKIARTGLDSLTPDERKQLERASNELKRQDG